MENPTSENPADAQWTDTSVTAGGAILFTKAIRGLVATLVLGSLVTYGAITVKPELIDYLSFVPGLESPSNAGCYNSKASYKPEDLCVSAGTCCSDESTDAYPSEAGACCLTSDACPGDASSPTKVCPLCPGSTSHSEGATEGEKTEDAEVSL